jgi:hypothetical protein
MSLRDAARSTAGGGRNVLVVSMVEDIGRSSFHAQLHEDDVVKVVVPVVGQGVFDWLANDERAFSHSVKVADRLADELPGETVDAGAGESDVGLAIRDALATFPADEIVVAVAREDMDLEDAIASGSDAPGGARRIEGIPVRFVTILDR